jgi:hypothetical protein
LGYDHEHEDNAWMRSEHSIHPFVLDCFKPPLDPLPPNAKISVAVETSKSKHTAKSLIAASFMWNILIECVHNLYAISRILLTNA